MINKSNGQFLLSVENVDYNLVKVCSGEFEMGSSFGLPLELPVHNSVIHKSFYISSYLVTQKLWQTLMGSNPSFNQALENNPVESISWYEANEFCKKLSDILRARVRLPTETEWEYCCRANTTSEYFFGNTSKELRNYGWYDLNAIRKTHPVGLKLPNPWGLYDIVGNVWQWCDDNWTDCYDSKLVESLGNPAISKNSSLRKVIRGGSYDLDDYRCRSSYRSFEHADFPSRKIGFRFVIERESSGQS